MKIPFKYRCQSVAGGWQTYAIEHDKLVGPVFNKLNDLWDWQTDNIYVTPEVLAHVFGLATQKEPNNA